MLPHLARSRSVLQVLCPLYQETVSVLLCTSRNVVLDGSNRKQILVSSPKVLFFFVVQGRGFEGKMCVYVVPFCLRAKLHSQWSGASG